MRTMFRIALALFPLALPPLAPARAESAQTQQLRLLCAQLSGDLTEPGGQAAFNRCLTDPPLAAMRKNMAPPAAPLPLTNAPVALVRPHQADPAVGASADACAVGYVWRLASPTDHVCVMPATRDLAAQDNALATRRLVAGTDRCAQGYVWREALPGDHVCVPPRTRAQAAADNAQADAHRLAASNPPMPSLDLCPLLDPAGIAARLGIDGRPVAYTDVRNHCEIAFNDAAHSLLDVDLVAAATSNFAQYRGAVIPGLGDRAVLTPLMPPGSDGMRQQTLAVMRGNVVLLVSLNRQPQRGPEAFTPIAAKVLGAN